MDNEITKKDVKRLCRVNNKQLDEIMGIPEIDIIKYLLYKLNELEYRVWELEQENE